MNVIENNEERLKKAKAYERIHNKLFLVNIILSFLILVIFVFSGLSKYLEGYVSQVSTNIWINIALYTAVCCVVSSILFLPVSFYSEYTLEHEFDLSNETIGGWAGDWAKSFFLNLLFLLIFAEVLHLFLRLTAQWWWIWVGFFWLLFGIVVSNIFPILILPLFYKVKPLENQALVDRLMKLSNSVKAKILGVFEMDLSRKSKKANAMFTGVGNTKRIILADTLVNNYTAEEIEAVLAHELGHYYYKHIWKLIAASTAATFAGLYLTKILLNHLLVLGDFDSVTDVAALPLFALVLSFFALLVMPITNTFSRYLERQADIFAIEKTGNPAAFISSMKKLSTQNLSNPDPNPFIEFVLYSHPAISKRIKLAEGYIKKV